MIRLRIRQVSLTVVVGVMIFADGSRAFEGADGMDQRFERLAERFVDQMPALSPVHATGIGDHRFDDQLDQVSSEARRRSADFYRGLLADLADIDAKKLSRANQVDYAMLEHHLRSRLWSLETLQEWAWNPLVYSRLSGSAIYGLMARDFAPLPVRLAHVAGRLEQFPRFFEQVRATLQPKRVPKVHAETAVKQNRGVLSILEHMVQPCLNQVPSGQRDRLEQAINIARQAVETHQGWLESELLPHAAGNFRLGAKLYDQKLGFALQTSMTRQQIRQRAEEELRDTRLRMYQIAKEIYRKRNPYTEFPAEPSRAYRQAIIRSCLEMAYADRPDPNRIVEAARRSLELTTAFVRKKDLVTVPSDPLEIIVMPEFERGVALAYCDSPGVLDVGLKTFYAVSPLPADWTPEQVQSFLREYNIRSLHNLTVHEAMPGHYLQLAHSNRYPGKLRAILSSGVFIEGWAVYAEWMMCEEGLLDGDPLMKLIVLKWYLRDMTNAILDQAVHVDGLSESDAMKFLTEDAFQEEREAAGKWRRAQLTSAQLSTYFVGHIGHTNLRREAEKAWGDDFDLKTYHDRVLSFGSPAIPFVRALLLGREIPLPEDESVTSQE